VACFSTRGQSLEAAHARTRRPPSVYSTLETKFLSLFIAIPSKLHHDRKPQHCSILSIAVYKNSCCKGTRLLSYGFRFECLLYLFNPGSAPRTLGVENDPTLNAPHCGRQDFAGSISYLFVCLKPGMSLIVRTESRDRQLASRCGQQSSALRCFSRISFKPANQNLFCCPPATGRSL
jgi:hypothetical protein